jgi:cellobiose-specific phosphotransferase system component IIA
MVRGASALRAIEAVKAQQKAKAESLLKQAAKSGKRSDA